MRQDQHFLQGQYFVSLAKEIKTPKATLCKKSRPRLMKIEENFTCKRRYF